MQVGDKYRVFEVLEKGQEYWFDIPNILGKHVCEVYPNREGVCPDVFIQKEDTHINLGVGTQAKHVATMRITKIK